MAIKIPQAHPLSKAAGKPVGQTVGVTRVLQIQSTDHKLQWGIVALVIGPTLEHCGYNLDTQYRNLLVIYAVVVPNFGHFPNKDRINLTWKGILPYEDGLWDQGTTISEAQRLCSVYVSSCPRM
jgi:hypothetical protein